MTKQELREHYAGLAMQALIIDDAISSAVNMLKQDICDPCDREVMASFAVEVADLLIGALACKHEKTSKVHGVMTCDHCKETILCEEDLT